MVPLCEGGEEKREGYKRKAILALCKIHGRAAGDD